MRATIRLSKGSPVRIRSQSHNVAMGHDGACFMHLTPGEVHNLPKAAGV